MIRLITAFLFALMMACPAYAYIETPSLEAEVKAGTLPPVGQRLPDDPRVINLKAMGRKPGKHGGSIRMLMGKQKDIRNIPRYGYARLIGFNDKLELQADILKSYEVEDGRIFTLHLRKGHKWSDGHPFTSEDFRYMWEDVFNNKKLSRGGLRASMKVNGKGPVFEVLDKYTVRYSWDAPNPNFLPAIAATDPLYLAKPAHYLKQFHKKYQDKEVLKKLVAENRVKNWRKLHIRKGRFKRPYNPDLPTLDPWRNTVAPPSERYVFKRNPYFHRVDENGRQLPYTDAIIVSTGSTQLIPAKSGAGDSDLQGRFLNFDDYTHLKSGEKRNHYRVLLWRSGVGSAVALLPNLNVKDKTWRTTLRDVRFRRALSIAINRHEINQISFFGLARESADTILPQSPLFKPEYQNAWSHQDIEMANQLLDDMGLTSRGSQKYRLFPDGRTVEIIVETAGENTLQSDVLELIKDYWHEIGVKLIIRNSQRDVLRRRAIAGLTVMSVWSGLDNAMASPDMSPRELAPTGQSQLQWPQWGNYVVSEGRKGEKPDLPEVKKLEKLFQLWQSATTTAQRRKIWHEMLHIYTDQVFTIGIVNGSLIPIVASDKLQNIPDKAVYSYSPTSYFGVYMPDTFWYLDAEKRGAAK